MPAHLHLSVTPRDAASGTPATSRPGRSTVPADEGRALVERHGAAARWLAVLASVRGDGDPSVSIVKTGVLDHPVTGEPVLAFVARGGTAKLTNLRRRPRATLVFHAEWEWVAVTGPVELAGPDDQLPGLDPGALPGLLRDIFHAAGGRHDDLAEYDRVMAAEHRTAVLLRPERYTTNPSGTEHVERG